jgi:hypothetical protein
VADKLASLVVSLELQSAQLKSGLDQVNKRLDSFGKNAKSVGKAIAGVLTADLFKDAILGMGRLVSRGAEVADQMGKLAQSVGVPVAELSKLRVAADLSGMSTQEFAANLGRLAKNMAAAAGGGREQSQVFRTLGVSVTDSTGKLRSAGDVMGDVAEKFAALRDGAAKTALAQHLFGKSGGDMIPLLNQGRAGLEAAAKSAATFGLVISEDAARAAERMNDSLRLLQLAGEGFTIQLSAAVAPAVTTLTEALLKANERLGVTETMVAAIGAVTTGWALGVDVLTNALSRMGEALTGSVAPGLRTVLSLAVQAASGDLPGAAARLVSGVWGTAQKVTTAALRRTLADPNSPIAVRSGGAGPEKPAAPVVGTRKKPAARSPFEQDPTTAERFNSLNDALVFTGDDLLSRIATQGPGFGASAFSEVSEGRKASAARAMAEARGVRAERQQEAMGFLGGKAAGRAGDVVGLVESGAAGFAAGGPLGAVMAVLGDLATQSPQFVRVVETVNGVIAKLGEALGPVFDTLAPVIELLGSLVEAALKPLGEVLKFAGQVVLGVVAGIGNTWNAILDFLDLFFDTSALKWDMTGVNDALHGLGEETENTANSMARAGESAERVAAAMTNLPAGFKVDPLRFRALDPADFGGGGGATGGGGSGSATGLPEGVPGGPGMINININGAGDVSLVADKVIEKIRQRDFRFSGTTA